MRRLEHEGRVRGQDRLDLERDPLGQDLVGVLALRSRRPTGPPIHELDAQGRDRLRAGTRRLEAVDLGRDAAAVGLEAARGGEVDDLEAAERLAELGHQHLDLGLGVHLELEPDDIA